MKYCCHKFRSSTCRLPFSNFSTVGVCNSNIREAVNGGHGHKALLLFRQMKHQGLEPNKLTFPILAKACAKLSNLHYSQIIHTHILKSPFWSDLYVQTALVGMYVKCNQLGIAQEVFDRMPQRDVASWNAMLLGFAQMGFYDKGHVLLSEMRVVGFQPDFVTLLALIQLGIHTRNPNVIKAIHCIGVHMGMAVDVSVSNTWVSAYAKCGDLNSAEMVFNEIDSSSRTVISWNSLIAGYAMTANFNGVLSIYKMMLDDGLGPDADSIVSMVSSFVEPNALIQGKLIHSHGIKSGFHVDISLLNTLISMYCKCGDINAGRYIFDNMSSRTCVSWNAMIGGYAEKGDMEEALCLFSAMKSAGEKPDFVTLVSLISGCGRTGDLELGKSVDAYATLSGLKSNLMICNALIDMYAKCGSISDASEVFNTMSERTVISWTSMITGFALNGACKEALDLFFLMLQQGMEPNQITFLAVLQACTHAGLLDKGLECFDLMTQVYKLDPELDHYSCMVDLLGRRGKLKEALEFIHNMPIEPDAATLGALLSASRLHHDVKIGELVAHNLFELEPQAAVSYVDMANIYASEGRWDGAATVRTMMRSKRIKNSPGESLVQLNAEACSFTVDDRNHPEG